MRHPRKPICIWADALYINEPDLVDKSFYNDILGDIYTHARWDVVCLGDDGENSKARITYLVLYS